MPVCAFGNQDAAVSTACRVPRSDRVWVPVSVWSRVFIWNGGSEGRGCRGGVFLVGENEGLGGLVLHVVFAPLRRSRATSTRMGENAMRSKNCLHISLGITYHSSR
jgi:hypothetical protein